MRLPKQVVPSTNPRIGNLFDDSRDVMINLAILDISKPSLRRQLRVHPKFKFFALDTGDLSLYMLDNENHYNRSIQ